MRRAHAMLLSVIVGSAACVSPDPVAPNTGGAPSASVQSDGNTPPSKAPEPQPSMRVMTPGSPAMPSSVPAVATAPAAAPDAGRAAVKFYVLVSKDVRHTTGRPNPEIEALVFGAIRGKLRTSGEIDLRSPDEPVGKTKLDKRAMRLTATIEPITYARPDWQISVVLRVERNSDGALLGEIRKKVLVAGVEAQNRAREDNLITTAIEAAAQDFAGRCAAFEEASFKKGGKK